MSFEEREKTRGYKIGTMVSYTISGCFMALLVGITVKILTWLF